MARKSDKESLWEIFKENGIEQITSTLDFVFPDHIKAVQEELLDSRQVLFRPDIEEALDAEHFDTIPPTAYSDPLPRHTHMEADRKKDPLIRLAIDLFSKAILLKSSESLEWGWTSLARELIFRKTKKSAGRTWAHKDMASQISIGGEDSLWEAGSTLRPHKPGISLLKHPKPDIYLGFPIHDPENSTTSGFETLPHFQNFTADVLGQLLKSGLVPTPTTTFKKEFLSRKKTCRWKRLADHKRICFPWAIIELKSHHNDYCYIQATNAASTSLCMFENLAKFANVQYGTQRIPPVFAFTFCGEEVKLWVAYSSNPYGKGGRNHKIGCIWQESITTFWGAFQLLRIVDKLNFWALHVLKPQISMYIDQWRHQYMCGTDIGRPVFENVDQQEIRQQLGRIEECLRSFGVDKINLERLLLNFIIREIFPSELNSTEEDSIFPHPSPNTPAQPYITPKPTRPPLTNKGKTSSTSTVRYKTGIPRRTSTGSDQSPLTPSKNLAREFSNLEVSSRDFLRNRRASESPPSTAHTPTAWGSNSKSLRSAGKSHLTRMNSLAEHPHNYEAPDSEEPTDHEITGASPIAKLSIAQGLDSSTTNMIRSSKRPRNKTRAGESSNSVNQEDEQNQESPMSRRPILFARETSVPTPPKPSLDPHVESQPEGENSYFAHVEERKQEEIVDALNEGVEKSNDVGDKEQESNRGEEEEDNEEGSESDMGGFPAYISDDPKDSDYEPSNPGAVYSRVSSSAEGIIGQNGGIFD